MNFGGKVHGGAVMKWIDQAGYTCAAGWTGTYCVTVYLGGLHFLGPIHVGELVELRALVIRTGGTSLDIAIDVYAGDPKSPERRRTGHCVVVFVAIGADGRPAAVRKWTPDTEVDRALRPTRCGCRPSETDGRGDGGAAEGVQVSVQPPT